LPRKVSIVLLSQAISKHFSGQYKTENRSMPSEIERLPERLPERLLAWRLLAWRLLAWRLLSAVSPLP
jgi:hypothetical protein